MLFHKKGRKEEEERASLGRVWEEFDLRSCSASQCSCLGSTSYYDDEVSQLFQMGKRKCTLLRCNNVQEHIEVPGALVGQNCIVASLGTWRWRWAE